MIRHLEYVQFEGKSTMSKIIKKWTRDKVSHSAVIDREAPTDKILLEQWPHKGGLKSWMDFNYFDEKGGHTKGTPYEVWSLAVDVMDYDWIMDFYRNSAIEKKPYDWAGIKAFGLKGKGNPDQTFCSEEMITPLALRLGWDRINPEVVHPGYFGSILQVAGAKLTQKGTI